ncbi:hypothetical protein DB88DRAFT_544217 [Papiliotrema laurentii]|uniref:Uncharacterized protein n=1 Tax=Papiliotrema laurentii TaxID=5418 RepID=A0AAD9FXB2_PAPLA|nr:hypothetical protein DB88DRAFT_544217 [Papiliotrema laurentii]
MGFATFAHPRSICLVQLRGERKTGRMQKDEAKKRGVPTGLEPVSAASITFVTAPATRVPEIYRASSCLLRSSDSGDDAEAEKLVKRAAGLLAPFREGSMRFLEPRPFWKAEGTHYTLFTVRRLNGSRAASLELIDLTGSARCALRGAFRTPSRAPTSSEPGAGRMAWTAGCSHWFLEHPLLWVLLLRSLSSSYDGGRVNALLRIMKVSKGSLAGFVLTNAPEWRAEFIICVRNSSIASLIDRFEASSGIFLDDAKEPYAISICPGSASPRLKFTLENLPLARGG